MKRRPVVAAVLVATLVIFSGSLWVASLLTHRDAPAGGQAHTQSATATAALAPSAHPTWPGYTSPDRQRSISSQARPAGFVDPPPGEGTGRYLAQQVLWQPCGKHECATVRAPLDWDAPDGQAITLAMLRVRSANPTRGPLFVNPGGPGGEGKGFAASIPQDAFAGYDIVGWDPRGTGESTPVRCASPEQLDAYARIDSSPDDEAEYEALVEASRDFARRCRAESGKLLDHVSTLDTVRDLDLLRALLGADKLSYLGISYGSYLGAVYAEFFPERVGRMILDSAVDITKEPLDANAEGFEIAFNSFVDWCLGRASCPFGVDREEVRSRIAAFVDGLDSAPLEAEGRQLTQTLAVLGIQSFFYGPESGYPRLVEALVSAMRGEGTKLLRASDWLTGRKDDGSYGTIASANPAIRCIDEADHGLEAARKQWTQVQRKAPLFGKWLGPSTGCEVWTAAPQPQYRLTGAGAPPIMVMGTRLDAATPYRHAVSMAQQLESGFLLTFEGSGHGAIISGSRCVLDAARDYLLHGRWKENTVCR